MEFFFWTLANDPRYSLNKSPSNPYLFWTFCIILDIYCLVLNVLYLEQTTDNTYPLIRLSLIALQVIADMALMAKIYADRQKLERRLAYDQQLLNTHYLSYYKNKSFKSLQGVIVLILSLMNILTVFNRVEQIGNDYILPQIVMSVVSLSPFVIALLLFIVRPIFSNLINASLPSFYARILLSSYQINHKHNHYLNISLLDSSLS